MHEDHSGSVVGRRRGQGLRLASRSVDVLFAKQDEYHKFSANVGMGAHASDSRGWCRGSVVSLPGVRLRSCAAESGCTHAPAKHGDGCGDGGVWVRSGSANGVHARLLRSLSQFEASQYCWSLFGAVLLSSIGFSALSGFGLTHSVLNVKISRENPKRQWAVGKSALAGRPARRDFGRRPQCRRKADQGWPEKCGAARGGIRQGMRAKLDSSRVAKRNDNSSQSSSCSSSRLPSDSCGNGECSSDHPVAR